MWLDNNNKTNSTKDIVTEKRSNLCSSLQVTTSEQG